MAVAFECIKPLIGSIVHVDRGRLLDPDVAAGCREMLDQRTVLVFPRVGLDDAEQLAFTDLLGSRVNLTSPVLSGDAKSDDVYPVTLDKSITPQPEYVLGTFFWHMDGLTADMPPPKATLRSARALSAEGGQTEFASTNASYDHLPAADKAEIDNLRTVHANRTSLRMIAEGIPPKLLVRLTGEVQKEHPIVWSRDSGRKSLVIGMSADTVVDMPLAHGRALLTRLVEWAAQGDFTYRHEWQEGDFVIWDNTGALHRVVPYSACSGRKMHRTSISGSEAVH